ncbi:hypothetical protein ABZP36_026128 [Zizania latifolia]
MEETNNQEKRVYPPQPLPHPQLEPHPQLPPQHDIFFFFLWLVDPINIGSKLLLLLVSFLTACWPEEQWQRSRAYL